MMKELNSADVVLFGELHDNPICHWLEYEVGKGLYETKGNKLVMGSEMFEADNQLALDSFLKGLLDDKQLKSSCRLWPNFKTDYKPMLDFAKEKSLPYVATNIPRRYASLVYKKGWKALDTLSDLEKSWMATLPMAYDANLSCYSNIYEVVGPHAGPNIAISQASKDATMAHFIYKNWSKGKMFYHVNGAYHSDNFESIYWYLKKLNPNLKIVTISTVLQDSVQELSKESKGKANYIIAIPESMTRTY